MSTHQSRTETPSWPGIRSQARAPLMLGLVVFLACLLGIAARFDNALASIWPANALMVGILLRVPGSATWAGWLCAGIAYLAADLLTGSDLPKAVLLNSANLIGVAVTYLVYTRLPNEMIHIRHPMSVLYLALACSMGACAAGVVGGIANPLLFDGSIMSGWTFWFITEYANFIAILPVILSAPPLSTLRLELSRSLSHRSLRPTPLPLIGLVLSCLATLAIGGPGAIAFPVPALLWCALTYSVFSTAILTLATSVWALVVISLTIPYDESPLISLRLGVFLIALGPIVLACVMQNHSLLLSTLQHTATHDALTGVSNRIAFLERSRQLLLSGRSPVGVMMIDLDHFKQVNDTHGHAAGDSVLVSATTRLRHCLQSDDLLGRLGGEEFAIVIVGRSMEDLHAIAERLRDTIAAEAIPLPDGSSISITASIGLSATNASTTPPSIEQLLHAADGALYRAKREGRNKTVLAS